MKTAIDIINMWRNWNPSQYYVYPSQIALYYWKLHLVTKQNKPLFPSSETNDIAAVIAGSKPSAIATIEPSNMLQKELLEITIKEKIYGIFVNNSVIVSKTNNLDKIEHALMINDKFSLGLLLGYPQHNVKDFVNKLGAIQASSIKMDEEYIKRLPVPEFQPSKDWFE